MVPVEPQVAQNAATVAVAAHAARPWITHIVFPVVAAYFAGALQEPDGADWRKRLARVSFDTVVVSLGIIAGVFGNIPDGSSLTGQSMVDAILAMFVSLFCVRYVARRAKDDPTGAQAFGCVVLAALSLALPWWGVIVGWPK